MKTASDLIKERGVKIDQQVQQRWFIAAVDGDGTHGTEVGKKYTYFEAQIDFKMANGREYHKGDWFLIEGVR